MNPARSNKWKFMVTVATARRSESRVPTPHYNHCHELFSTASSGAASDAKPVTRRSALTGQSAHETISCSEGRPVFCDVIVCVLIEGPHRFWTGICLSDTRTRL
jgi:hypothetical protein